MNEKLKIESLKHNVILHDFIHLKGNHCETTSLMKVLNHMGFSFEEEFLFGLGGGLVL